MDPHQDYDDICGRCSKCQMNGQLIGDKYRPPKKNDTKAWNSIKSQDLAEYCVNLEKHHHKRHNTDCEASDCRRCKGVKHSDDWVSKLLNEKYGHFSVEVNEYLDTATIDITFT